MNSSAIQLFVTVHMGVYKAFAGEQTNTKKDHSQSYKTEGYQKIFHPLYLGAKIAINPYINGYFK